MFILLNESLMMGPVHTQSIVNISYYWKGK